MGFLAESSISIRYKGPDHENDVTWGMTCLVLQQFYLFRKRLCTHVMMGVPLAYNQFTGKGQMVTANRDFFF